MKNRLPNRAKLDGLLKRQNKRWVIDRWACRLARWNEVDPRLILSIAAESNFQFDATSPKSAMGLMQLIPETAERFNVSNACNATQTSRQGLRYVQWLVLLSGRCPPGPGGLQLQVILVEPLWRRAATKKPANVTRIAWRWQLNSPGRRHYWLAKVSPVVLAPFRQTGDVM
jgi:hypothetical protein